jgi:hypothetical protein
MRGVLANVEPVAPAVFVWPQQQVHAGLLQLGPGGHAGLRPGRTRKHQRLAVSVGAIHDAQAIGVPVGDEDAEGEGLWHLNNLGFGARS